MSQNYLSILGIFVKDLTFFSNNIPKKGQTVLGNKFISGPGGKGTNQAIAAKRSGSRVNIIVKIGNDIFGDEALELFGKENINKENIFISDSESTGTAGIYVNNKGENSIIVYPGSSSTISKEDIDIAKNSIESSSIFLTQLEVPLEIVKYSLKIARRKKIKTILNPAPASYKAIDLLPLCDIITPNIHEASEMSGINIINNDDIEKAGKTLLNFGVNEVIITHGDNGFIYFSKDNFYSIPAQNYGTVIDTTGAGDSFNGALASGINLGMNTLDAAIYANCAASISVTKEGTSLAMPYQEEINSLFRLNK